MCEPSASTSVYLSLVCSRDSETYKRVILVWHLGIWSPAVDECLPHSRCRGCGVPLTIQVLSNASGWVDVISHDAGARVSGYLAQPKLHGQIEAGAGQPPSVSGQAGSHVSGRLCTT